MNAWELQQFKKAIEIMDAREKKRKHKRKISRKVSRELKSHIHECEECWSTKKLQVHHIDKNPKNNEISNLQKLCLKCHMEKHIWDPVYRLMAKMLKLEW